MHVLCVLTPGHGLVNWQRFGTLQRELQPYLHYLRHGGRVTFLECLRGGIIPSLPRGLSVTRVPHWRLLRLWEWTHPSLTRSIDIIKTNQSSRAYVFVKLARRLGKPIVLRCGYVRGEFLETVYGVTPQVRRYQQIEAWAFRNATLGLVPTQELAEWVIERYGVLPERLRVVPNYVDTDLFSPGLGATQRTEPVVISVGRLEPVKRFDLLIRAYGLAGPVRLRIAGRGSQHDALIDLAQQLGVPLELAGQIPNERLPEFLRSGTVFALVSQWEGHPKALIEAMACGMACVCVDAPGLRNIAQDGVNAVVVPPDPTAVADAIQRLLSDDKLRRRLGEASRRFVVERFSMAKVLDADMAVLEEAIQLGVSD